MRVSGHRLPLHCTADLSNPSPVISFVSGRSWIVEAMATDCVQRPPKTTPVTTLYSDDHLTVFTRVTYLNSSRCTSMLMSNNLSAPATRGLAAKPINSLRGEQLPADRDLILGEQGQIRPLMKQGRQSTFSRLHRAGKLPKSLYSHRSRVNDWARPYFPNYVPLVSAH